MEARRKNAGLYNKLLSGSVETPVGIRQSKARLQSIHHKNKRQEQTPGILKSKGIGAMIYYPLACIFRKFTKISVIKKEVCQSVKRSRMKSFHCPSFRS